MKIGLCHVIKGQNSIVKFIILHISTDKPVLTDKSQNFSKVVVMLCSIFVYDKDSNYNNRWQFDLEKVIKINFYSIVI